MYLATSARAEVHAFEPLVVHVKMVSPIPREVDGDVGLRDTKVVGEELEQAGDMVLGGGETLGAAPVQLDRVRPLAF